MLENVDNLQEAVFISLGAVSMCWENVDKAGLFKSDEAKIIGNELVEWIQANINNGVI